MVRSSMREKCGRQAPSITPTCDEAGAILSGTGIYTRRGQTPTGYVLHTDDTRLLPQQLMESLDCETSLNTGRGRRLLCGWAARISYIATVELTKINFRTRFGFRLACFKSAVGNECSAARRSAFNFVVGSITGRVARASQSGRTSLSQTVSLRCRGGNDAPKYEE